MIERSWVRIPAPYTGWNWHFFILICCKNCIDVCLKRPKINEKVAGVGQFFKKETSNPSNIFSNNISAKIFAHAEIKDPSGTQKAFVWPWQWNLRWLRESSSGRPIRRCPLTPSPTRLHHRMDLEWVFVRAWNENDVQYGFESSKLLENVPIVMAYQRPML